MLVNDERFEILRQPRPERWSEHAKRIVAAEESGKLRFIAHGDRMIVEADQATIEAINGIFDFPQKLAHNSATGIKQLLCRFIRNLAEPDLMSSMDHPGQHSTKWIEFGKWIAWIAIAVAVLYSLRFWLAS